MAIAVILLILLGLLIDYAACRVGGEEDRRSEEWFEEHYEEWRDKHGKGPFG